VAEAGKGGVPLPDGWTEKVHHASARSYSTFHGPNEKKARSRAEAVRMYKAAGKAAAPRTLRSFEVPANKWDDGVVDGEDDGIDRDDGDGDGVDGEEDRVEDEVDDGEEDGNEDGEEDWEEDGEVYWGSANEENPAEAEARKWLEESDGDESCAVCKLRSWKVGNELLLCDGEGCSVAMHTRCLNPPLDHVPEGEWFCSACTERRAAFERPGRRIFRGFINGPGEWAPPRVWVSDRAPSPREALPDWVPRSAEFCPSEQS